MKLLYKLFRLIIILGACILGACDQYDKSNIIRQYKPVYFDGKSQGLFTGQLQYKDLFLPKLKAKYSLRDQILFTNIKALTDLRKNSSFTGSKSAALFKNKVAGTQYNAFMHLSVNEKVQFSSAVFVPDNFNLQNPCLVVVASKTTSNLGGLYGAMAEVGLWAGAMRCALVLSDLGKGLNIIASDDDGNNPLNIKNSFENNEKYQPELVFFAKNNGRYGGDILLSSGKYGLTILKEHFAKTNILLKKKKVKIISAGSYFAAAAILKARQKEPDFFDGLVISQPTIAFDFKKTMTINYEESFNHKVTLPFLYQVSLASLYEPCAVLSQIARSLPGAKLIKQRQKSLASWCGFLVADNLLNSSIIDEQAAEAYTRIKNIGFASSTDIFMNYNVLANVWQKAMINYAVLQKPILPKSALQKSMKLVKRWSMEKNELSCLQKFNLSNNSIVTKQQKETYESNKALKLNVLEDFDSYGEEKIAITYNIMKCLYYEINQEENKLRFRQAYNLVKLDSTKSFSPLIIVQGQNDRYISASNFARPLYYLLKNNSVDASQVRYYEVQKVGYFDNWLSTFPDLGSELYPLQYYVHVSLDLMYNHLFLGTSLPWSQVVINKKPYTDQVMLGGFVNISPSPEYNRIIIDEGKIIMPMN